MIKKGFTLVELVIVIGIISILSAVAIPSYISMRERALNRRAVAALRLIRVAEMQYKAQNEKFYNSSSGLMINYLPQINGNLSLNIVDPDWQYAIICWDSTCSSFFSYAFKYFMGYERRWTSGDGFPEPVCFSFGGYCDT